MKKYWEYLTELGSKTRIWGKIFKNRQQQKDEKIMSPFTEIANIEIPLIRSFFGGFRKMFNKASEIRDSDIFRCYVGFVFLSGQRLLGCNSW